MSQNLQLFSADTFAATEAEAQRLSIANDADPREADLSGIGVVELHFPSSATAEPSARPSCCAAAWASRARSAPRATY